MESYEIRKPRKIYLLMAYAIASVLILSLSACGILASENDQASDIEPTPESGTIVIKVETTPSEIEGSFAFDGVPKGEISQGATLVVSDQTPGVYSTVQIESGSCEDIVKDEEKEDEEAGIICTDPGFILTDVVCDDATSPSSSSGDAETRTAVIGLDPGETVTCTFVNTRKASIAIAAESVPSAAEGSFSFLGDAIGTIPTRGTLVASDLDPGRYEITQVEPGECTDLNEEDDGALTLCTDSGFIVTSVVCDDANSPTPSRGDAETRTAVINLDPGELVTCTFVNTRRNTVIVSAQATSDGSDGNFTYSGTPAGTIPANGTLVVSGLAPGEYQTTQEEPVDSDLTSIQCDDSDSATPSRGDTDTRTATFYLDAGEVVTCTFVHGFTLEPTPADPDPSSESSETSILTTGINPFSDPDTYLENFQLPDELPPDAGTYPLPLEGTWNVEYLSGSIVCEGNSIGLPPAEPERGSVTVSDDEQEIYAVGLEESEDRTLTLTADPELIGRFKGEFDSNQEGFPITETHFWQLVDQENIIGYFTFAGSAEGVECDVYRPFEMSYLN